MKVAIPLKALSGASPLHDYHLPKTIDEKHLDHYLQSIPQIKKGLVGLKVDYDSMGDSGSENCRIELTTDNATATMELSMGDEGWAYTAQLKSNGSERNFEGTGSHNSKQALVRKVSGLINIMLQN